MRMFMHCTSFSFFFFFFLCCCAPKPSTACLHLIQLPSFLLQLGFSAMGTCLQLCRATPFTNASFVPSVLQLRHRHPSSLSSFHHPNCLNLVNGKPLYSSSRSHFHSYPCQASAAWPYGNWERDEESEKLRRSWIDSVDWDGGLEVLAVVSGVAVSLGILASRRGASGLPASVYIIVFLMAGMGALRHQIGYLWKSVQAKSVNVQTSTVEQLLNFQRNLRTWVSIMVVNCSSSDYSMNSSLCGFLRCR